MSIRTPAFPPILTEKITLIDRELEKILPQKEPQENFYAAMRYALASGGKRIRPALCLVTCEGLGGKGELALPYAISLEILHNMTLTHDDIMDGDRTRRDQPSIWVKYGISHGINVGDGMYCLALAQITKANYPPKLKADLLSLLNDTALHIFEGQAFDVDLREFDSASEQVYMESVKQKTGVLIAAAVVGGAIIAGASEEMLSALTQYGNKIGMAFQIRDDVIDLTEGKGRGGEIGCDIKEGKKSLIAIHALNHAFPEDAHKLISILQKEREEKNQEDINWVISLYKKLGSIKYAQLQATELIEDAIAALRVIPSKELRTTLEDLAYFIVHRNK